MLPLLLAFPVFWGLLSQTRFLFFTSLFAASYVSSQTIWVEFAPVSTILNATDDFLIPISVGSEKQIVNLAPSLGQSASFLIGPKACTPKGGNSPKVNCTIYRGGVFDTSKSASFSAEGKGYDYINPTYSTFSKGTYVKDTLFLGAGDNGDWKLENYEFALIDSSNMTSGFLGLGKDSTVLKQLYEDGKIASRSYGLHVGLDIWNHPWPILNPSFDESGNRPTTDDDFDSGVGKRDLGRRSKLERRQDDEDKLPVRESHKFPGSLTLGGYDKAKISNKTKPLTVPIAKDGSLQLTMTKMVVRNILPNAPFSLLKKKHSVVIDADTPHMYFPGEIARELGDTLGASYGYPGLDFFYSYSSDTEAYLGNVTMTLTAPDGTGGEIEIVLPPTVWFQPVGYMRNFELVGEEYYSYYAPIREEGEGLPIVLGRSFLKAAYLFVNHDANHFKISQVAYTNATTDIVVAEANGDTTAPDDANPGSTGSGNNGTANGNQSGTQSGAPSGQKDGKDGLTLPVPVLAGAAGGGVLLIVALIIIIIVLKKRRNKDKTKKQEERPGTGGSDLPLGGRTELGGDDVAMVKLASRPSTAVSGIELPPNNIAEKDPNTPELPSGPLDSQKKVLYEIGTRRDYQELDTKEPMTPKQTTSPVAVHPASYPPPPVPPQQQTNVAPPYPYQRYPPPPGPPPPITQLPAGYIPPPSAPVSPLPAGYIPPPPPPGPPPGQIPPPVYSHQYPAQAYGHPNANTNQHSYAHVHELA